MEVNPWGCRCWLLCSPRSGSTYLQYVLNQSAGVALGLPEHREVARYSFGEHLHEKNCKDFASFLLWSPMVTKMHCHHFGKYLVDKQEILRLFPDIRFVLLQRKDLYAQAVSLSYANLTGITQVETNEALEPAILSDELLLDSYRTVKDYSEFWPNWLYDAPHLTLSYEGLIDDPIRTVALILDYLDTPYDEVSIDVPISKMNRPDSEQYIKRLQELIDIM